MRITFVHGRAQAGKDPAALQAEWEAALDEGLRAADLEMPADLEVRFPFYGDTLAELVAEVDARTGSREARARGEASATQHDALQAELVLELARRHGIEDAQIERRMQSAEGDRKGEQRGPLSWAWVQAILAALDDTPLGGVLLDQFTHDVAVYLSYPEVAAAVDAIVAAQIGPEPGLVVAHSLGSVVGYNVLHAAASGVEVPLLLTLGSPLGLDSIKSKLPTPPTHPARVNAWVNAYDERDVVALVPLDEEQFDVTPPIANIDDLQNDTDNHHGISGYLDRAAVGRVIHAGLGP